MPSVPLHTPQLPTSTSKVVPNPLPPLLQTPAGLAILEIQGSLHTPPPSTEQEGGTGMTDIGKLVFPLYNPQASGDDVSWMKKVYLYVGRHQRLTGQVVKLGKGKSVGVVRKRQNDDENGLEIVDVVRYKIVSPLQTCIRYGGMVAFAPTFIPDCSFRRVHGNTRGYGCACPDADSVASPPKEQLHEKGLIWNDLPPGWHLNPRSVIHN